MVYWYIGVSTLELFYAVSCLFILYRGLYNNIYELGSINSFKVIVFLGSKLCTI